MSEKVEQEDTPRQLVDVEDVQAFLRLVGVETERLAAPGDLEEPYRERRTRWRKQHPAVVRSIQAGLRCIELARAAAALDPTDARWSDITLYIDRVYAGAFFHGWTEDRLKRVFVLDAINAAAREARVVEAWQVLEGKSTGAADPEDEAVAEARRRLKANAEAAAHISYPSGDPRS